MLHAWNSSLKQMHILWNYTESTFTQKNKTKPEIHNRNLLGNYMQVSIYDIIYTHNQRSAHGACIRDMEYSIFVPRMAYTWRLC